MSICHYDVISELWDMLDHLICGRTGRDKWNVLMVTAKAQRQLGLQSGVYTCKAIVFIYMNSSTNAGVLADAAVSPLNKINAFLRTPDT